MTIYISVHIFLYHNVYLEHKVSLYLNTWVYHGSSDNESTVHSIIKTKPCIALKAWNKTCMTWDMNTSMVPADGQVVPYDVWVSAGTMLNIQGPRVHILHPSKSSANEHKICESRGNFLRNGQKFQFWPILTYSESKRAQKWSLGAYIRHTSKSISNELENKYHMNPVETFCKIDRKLTFDLFWPYLG